MAKITILLTTMIITLTFGCDTKEYGPISGPIQKPFEPIR